jgi:hypothetical protein
MGFKLWQQDEWSVLAQFDVRNVTDRLNVINFNGLFSEPPRPDDRSPSDQDPILSSNST